MGGGSLPKWVKPQLNHFIVFRISAGAKVPAHAVMCAEAAQDEAAAVKGHKGWRARRVDPQKPPGPWMVRWLTLPTAAGAAIRLISASYCSRAAVTVSVCVAGTPGLLVEHLRIRRHLLSSLYSGDGLIWMSYDRYAHRAATLPDRGIKREHGPAYWKMPWLSPNS